MSKSCPNCKLPCAPCAGVKIVTASDGATVCTKCIGQYEMTKGIKKKEQGEASPQNVYPTHVQGSAPTITGVKAIYNNFNNCVLQGHTIVADLPA